MADGRGPASGYDVLTALRELRHYRAIPGVDPVRIAVIGLSEDLARYLVAHFPHPPDAAIAGVALVIAGGATSSPRLPPPVVSTVVALAGQRLIEGPPR